MAVLMQCAYDSETESAEDLAFEECILELLLAQHLSALLSAAH